MVATRRGSPRDLIGELRRSPDKFRFFQAVRLLALAEPIASRRGGGVPGNLRFRTPASLAFPASEITRFAAAPTPSAPYAGPPSVTAAGGTAETGTPFDGAKQQAPTRDEMEVACLGLTGPSGALPTPYSELLIERRVHHRDDSAHAFLDVFSHRSLALFYEAWRKYRFHIAHERGEAHSFERGLKAITGTDFSAPATKSPTRETDAAATSDLGPESFLYYAGLLARRPISASALTALVRDLFDVNAELRQFVGRWVAVPAAEQSRLGKANAILGDSACIGERAWDAQSQCCLALGPMSAATYEALLPGREGNLALTELLKFCFGHSLAINLQLQLDRNEVPPARLGAPPGQARPGRLGQTLWLAREPLQRDPNDASFALIA